MTPQELEKRKKIMRRSMVLGHCVCDPKKPCPCPLLKEKNICECAGERLPLPAARGPIRLTEYVRNAGCASKISKNDLHTALSGLPEMGDPRVIIGRSAGDDAGVILLSPETATILTVDVFAPAVDDPYTFGQISAANSISDIYAMGGKPEAALSIIGFPIHTLPPEVMREILRGGIDKMAEAGIDVVGGHSINDEEIKCGFAVFGTAPKEKIARNAGAHPGDCLVLTKPLGVGIVAFANQIGRATPEQNTAIATSMMTLNKIAGESMFDFDASAATDVTGFSLLGHLSEIVKNSQVEVEIHFDTLPLFPGVKELARAEVLPGALERNRESVPEKLLDLSALAPAQRDILFCPETSGGLLVFLPEKKAKAYVAHLQERGIAVASIVGRVTKAYPGGLIKGITKEAASWSPINPPQPQKEKVEPAACGCSTPEKTPPPETTASCCASLPATVSQKETSLAPLPEKFEPAFKNALAESNAPGALDTKTKKLIALALSIQGKCEPCVLLNTAAARAAGASDPEIAEAAALGISFGGAPALMFYKNVGRK